MYEVIVDVHFISLSKILCTFVHTDG